MEFEKFGFTEEEVILKLLRVHLPLPLYEPHRIRVLKETKILNSSRNDVRFDRFTQLCARVFSTPISLISFLDIDQCWIKSSVGFQPKVISRDHAFCSHLLDEHALRVLLFRDTKKDCRSCHSPLVSSCGIRFYAGTSIICGGMKIGTLCVMDTQPRYDFDEQNQLILLDIAACISSLLEEQRKRNLEEQEQLVRSLGTFYRQLHRASSALMLEIRSIRNHPSVSSTLMEDAKGISSQIQGLQKQVHVIEQVVDKYMSTPMRSPVRSSLWTPTVSLRYPSYLSGREVVRHLREQVKSTVGSTLDSINWDWSPALSHTEIQLIDETSLCIVLAAALLMGSVDSHHLTVTVRVEGIAGLGLAGHEQTGRLVSHVDIIRPRPVRSVSRESNDLLEALDPLCSQILRSLHGGMTVSHEVHPLASEEEMLRLACWLPCKIRQVSDEHSVGYSSSCTRNDGCSTACGTDSLSYPDHPGIQSASTLPNRHDEMAFSDTATHPHPHKSRGHLGAASNFNIGASIMALERTTAIDFDNHTIAAPNLSPKSVSNFYPADAEPSNLKLAESAKGWKGTVCDCLSRLTSPRRKVAPLPLPSSTCT
eukprot:gene3606-3949_t